MAREECLVTAARVGIHYEILDGVWLGEAENSKPGPGLGEDSVRISPEVCQKA